MKIAKHIVLALCLLGGSSCSSDFLETVPTDAYSETTILSNVENAKSALNGIHRAMYAQYDTQNQAGYSSVMIYNDMLGEDLVNTAQGNGWWIGEYRWQNHRNVNGSSNFHVYRFFYKLISNANMILAQIDDLPGDDATRKQVKGEALAYRGMAHFWLVQFYANRYSASNKSMLGVPLMLTPTTAPQPRATIDQVYQQVLIDLNEAEQLVVPKPNSGYNKSHFTQSSVKGILSRVYLAMEDWSNAALKANEARTAFEGTLMSSTQYKTGFSDAANPEWMWASIMIPDQTVYFYSYFAYMTYNFNSSNIRTNPKAINSTLYGKIAATDVRKWCWEPAPTAENFPLPLTTFLRFPFMNRKFAVKDAGSSVGDIPNMRLSEMYLNEAEAKARAGASAEAQQILHEFVVVRDPAYTKSTATGDALINEIMTHRRVELWGEGFRFTDLKRLNLPLDRENANHSSTITANLMSVPAGDNQWLFLFPQSEVNTNPFVAENQNP